jgi:vacuolar-type H+-ATPase subunit C/Vma6
MKITFYSSQEEDSLMQEMPLGIGYIWAYLEQQMPEVKIRYARNCILY